MEKKFIKIVFWQEDTATFDPALFELQVNKEIEDLYKTSCNVLNIRPTGPFSVMIVYSIYG